MRRNHIWNMWTYFITKTDNIARLVFFRFHRKTSSESNIPDGNFRHIKSLESQLRLWKLPCDTNCFYFIHYPQKSLNTPAKVPLNSVGRVRQKMLANGATSSQNICRNVVKAIGNLHSTTKETHHWNVQYNFSRFFSGS